MTIFPSSRLHPEAKKVLGVIKDFRRRHGFSPSIVEISESVAKAKSTTYSHLKNLERWGYITMYPRKPRGIELRDPVLSRSPEERLVKEYPAGAVLEFLDWLSTNPPAPDLAEQCGHLLEAIDKRKRVTQC